MSWIMNLLELGVAFILGLIWNVISSLFTILPKSPLLLMEDIIVDSEILAFLNFFVPFDFITVIYANYLTAYGLWYAIKFVKGILKSVPVIGDAINELTE